MTRRLEPAAPLYVLAVVLGLAGGALVLRSAAMAAMLGLGVATLFALLLLGSRALPLFVVGVACIPYFPIHEGFRGDPFLTEALIPGFILMAAAVPAGWSLITQRTQRELARSDVVVAALILITLFALLVSRRDLALTRIPAGAVLAGITAYLCAKRFPRPEDWLMPAAAGMAVLLGWGLAEYVDDPSRRVGYFVGYPILFGALIVGLAPMALAWLYPRSRLGAGILGVAAAMALLFSESRSAWLAAIMVMVLGLLFLVRGRRPGSAAFVLIVVAAMGVGIAQTGELSSVVETRLSEGVLVTEAVTHRQYSYGYTWERFTDDPFVGAGYPGALKEDIENRTGIDAADNGLLSLAGDLGILGIVLGLLPAAVVIPALARQWQRDQLDTGQLSLGLSIVGLLVVTMFFDIYYWPQAAVLIFGMAGCLSARMRADAAVQHKSTP